MRCGAGSFRNPNDFIAIARRCIKGELAKIVVQGIQYEKIAGSIYELRELQADGAEEKEHFLDQMYQVQNRQKTDFDYVVYDSEVECKFAQLLDTRGPHLRHGMCSEEA